MIVDIEKGVLYTELPTWEDGVNSNYEKRRIGTDV